MNITQFIAHFGIIELSIGTALGLSFKTTVNSITTDIIKPILEHFFHIKELSGLCYKIMGIKFGFGNALLALINFIVLLGVVFALIYIFLWPIIRKILEEKTKTDVENVEQNTRNVEQNVKIIKLLRDIRDRPQGFLL